MPESKTPPSSPARAFVSNHSMVIRLSGRLTGEHVQAAADRIRPRHTAIIPGFSLEQPVAGHFPVQTLEGCGEKDWETVVEAGLLEPFPARQGPFARFTLLRRGDAADLVAVFDHGRCDGISGVYVMRDLLESLADPARPVQPLPPPPDTPGLIPASVKDSPRMRRRIAWFLTSLQMKMLARRLMPKARAGRPGLANPAEARFQLVSETLTEAQTARLVARCKSEGVSVHAAVCSAWLRASAAERLGGAAWMRSISSPVSLRERLGAPETSSMYLATVLTRLDCRPGRDFWRAAVDFKQRLNRATTDEELYFYPLSIRAAFAKFSGPQTGEMARLLFGTPVKYDFSITNLGVLPLASQYGSLRLEAYYNLVNTNPHERTLCVNTLAGRLRMSLLVRESNLTANQAQQLFQTACAQLIAASE